jgi:hypothetical protein
MGINPYAMQVLYMRHRCGTRSSALCCKSAGTIPSVPADLYGLKVSTAHLILDWVIRFCWPCPLSRSSISNESGKWTLNNSLCLLSRLSVLPIRQPNCADLIGRLFRHILHESGTAWYIVDLLAVSPPWGSLIFPNFFVVTGEGFLIGIPSTCSLGCIKQPSGFSSKPTQLFIPPKCGPWCASGPSRTIPMKGRDDSPLHLANGPIYVLCRVHILWDGSQMYI